MFGADTPLVMDALQIAAIAAIGAGGLVFVALRRRKPAIADPSCDPATNSKGSLEERIEVLERIATDQSIGLADEIEALRDTTPANSEEPAA